VSDGLVRFTAQRPCPICGGYDGKPRGQGVRCYGWQRDDDYARCTREEHAGGLPRNSDSTYSHRLHGPCDCGLTHGPAEPDRELVVRHEVRDPEGRLLGVHCRQATGLGKKRMWWEGPNGRKGLGGLHPADMLYGAETLKDLPPGEPVGLTEGEPAADALARLGLAAVGTVTGAGQVDAPHKISAAAASMLAGREVWVWPDDDGEGRAHMRANARVLAAEGCEVRWVRWPTAPSETKWDAAEFVAHGGTAAEVTELLVAVEDEPRAQPDIPADAESGGGEGARAAEAADRAELLARARIRRFDVRAALTEPPPPMDWLLDEMIERGQTVWIGGPGGAGKSILALSLGVSMLRGVSEWCGRSLGAIDRLVYLDAENRDKTIRRRLHLLGVPMEVVDRLDYYVLRSADLGSSDGRAAFECITRGEGHGLVALDSLVALHRADEDKATEVRALIDRWRWILEESDCTGLGLAHENRSGNLRGSLDWRNAVESVLELKADSDRWRTLATTEKVRESEGGAPIRFRFRQDDTPEGRRLSIVPMSAEQAGGRPPESDVDTMARRIVEVRRADPSLNWAQTAARVGSQRDHAAFKRARAVAKAKLERTSSHGVLGDDE
jgi:hypothetical protein